MGREAWPWARKCGHRHGGVAMGGEVWPWAGRRGCWLESMALGRIKDFKQNPTQLSKVLWLVGWTTSF